jgi:hypothetical protein
MVEQFSKASPGLPICMTRDNLLSKMKSTIQRQIFHDKFFNEMPERKSNILKVLQTRGSVGNNINSWDRIFSIFPQTKNDLRYIDNLEYKNGLKQLFEKYFGEVQVSFFYLCTIYLFIFLFKLSTVD